MENSTLHQEITIVEIKNHETGDYFSVNINAATKERAIITGNHDIPQQEFDETVEKIIGFAPDKFLIYTGNNSLGVRFTELFSKLGKIVLLVHPETDTSSIDGDPKIKIVHSLNPSLDMINWLSHVAIIDFEKAAIVDSPMLEETNTTDPTPIVCYPDESTYY